MVIAEIVIPIGGMLIAVPLVKGVIIYSSLKILYGIQSQIEIE